MPQAPRTKPIAEWRLTGGRRALPRIDVPAKVDGSAVYGIDVKLPGLVHAAVVSAPTIGGRIVTIDDAAVRGKPGIIAVVPLGSAVAVVAEHWWQARAALEQLSVAWADGPAGKFDAAAIDALYRNAMAGDAWAAAERHGDAVGVLARAQARLRGRILVALAGARADGADECDRVGRRGRGDGVGADPGTADGAGGARRACSGSAPKA